MKEKLKLKGLLLYDGYRSPRERVLCSVLNYSEEIWKSDWVMSGWSLQSGKNCKGVY